MVNPFGGPRRDDESTGLASFPTGLSSSYIIGRGGPRLCYLSPQGGSPDAGHAVNIDQPQAFDRAVRSFLSTLSPDSDGECEGDSGIESPEIQEVSR